MLKRCFKPKYARLDPIYDLILRFFYFESLGVRQFFEKSAIYVLFLKFPLTFDKEETGFDSVVLENHI